MRQPPIGSRPGATVIRHRQATRAWSDLTPGTHEVAPAAFQGKHWSGPSDVRRLARVDRARNLLMGRSAAADVAAKLGFADQPTSTESSRAGVGTRRANGVVIWVGGARSVSVVIWPNSPRLRICPSASVSAMDRPSFTPLDPDHLAGCHPEYFGHRPLAWLRFSGSACAFRRRPSVRPWLPQVRDHAVRLSSTRIQPKQVCPQRK